MIRQSEIQRIASKQGLRDTQIEKDYVIGWALNGIANQKYLKDKLIFKGGTALRKVYFQDYRLSEDLDFTYAEDNLNSVEIIENFNELTSWVAEESRISLSIQDETEHETGNFSFYLSYSGPLGGRGENKKIKIDISGDEILCNAPLVKNILNAYSDLDDYSIPTYTLGEIIAEKMRSLMQRSEPRDLYDLWYLFEIEREDIQNHIFDFQKKAEYQSLNHANFIKIVTNKEAVFKRQWENRLVNQVLELPNFDDVWRELGKHWRRYTAAG